MNKINRSNAKRKHPVLAGAAVLAMVLLAVGAIYSHFGGFGTGPSADPAELAKYASGVDALEVPDHVSIIALGEATHGNAEFQQLKREVFALLVERYGVRAFALEGDFGGCETVNRYIHGGAGTPEEAAAAIGFDIYRTEQMADLIRWMRAYNDTAPAGEDLRFYGIDMQRGAASYGYLLEECRKAGVSTAALEPLVVDGSWDPAYTYPQREAAFAQTKEALEQAGASAFALQLAKVLCQHCRMFGLEDAAHEGDAVRDAAMLQNVLWVSAQEKAMGHEQIFVAGHNGHVEKNSYPWRMGVQLAKTLGEDYYVISTDFYKSRDNVPGANRSRMVKTFYSRNPLAKAAKRAGFAVCLLDLARIPADSSLKTYTTDYYDHAAIGDVYSPVMAVLPAAYRLLSKPEESYNCIIYVTNATPTVIR